jgi:xanthine dehydrogenase molybdopterin-binding subunit B
LSLMYELSIFLFSGRPTFFIKLSAKVQLDLYFSINVKVRRIGGGYGAKLTRNSVVSVACAAAAQILNRPVRLIMSLESNMEAIGKRCEVAVNYEVSLFGGDI